MKFDYYKNRLDYYKVRLEANVITQAKFNEVENKLIHKDNLLNSFIGKKIQIVWNTFYRNLHRNDWINLKRVEENNIIITVNKGKKEYKLPIPEIEFYIENYIAYIEDL